MNTAAPVPSVTLNNGVTMPQLGFGVWQITPDERATEAVLTAFDAGYRAVDTARIYTNEGGVGAAIEASDLDRSDVFVTTKLWNNEQGYDSTLRAFDNSLAKLRSDYVDLYLIHWPVPFHGRVGDTWRAFEKLYSDGRVRAIGVSNFEPNHLRELMETASVVPSTRSSSTLTCSSTSCFSCTGNWALRPSRGVRSDRARCSQTPSSRPLQTASGVLPPR
jgi:2,5-diketo-D-gluconate reductase A